jgi:recombination protein RecR
MASDPLENVIFELSRLPGIGRKSAGRLAFHLLSVPEETCTSLANSILDLKQSLSFCSDCFHIAKEGGRCQFCENEARDHSKICIVADPKDLLAIERTKRYNGVYHVLGGLISPLDGITPDQLHVKELIGRISKQDVSEVVFALTPSIEGETTTLYLKKLLSPLGISLSQIAYGIPMGSELDWADEMTLSKSFDSRLRLS